MLGFELLLSREGAEGFFAKRFLTLCSPAEPPLGLLPPSPVRVPWVGCCAFRSGVASATTSVEMDPLRADGVYFLTHPTAFDIAHIVDIHFVWDLTAICASMIQVIFP